MQTLPDAEHHVAEPAPALELGAPDDAPGAAPPGNVRGGTRTGRASLAVGSAAIAFGVSTGLNALLFTDGELEVESDVIGYPTFHDFDSRHYIEIFWLAAAVFPVVMAASYVLLGRLLPRIFARYGNRRAMVGIGAAGRIAVPGLAVGLTAAVAAGASGGAVWRAVGAGVVGYGAAVGACAAVLGAVQRDLPFARCLALVNAAAVPLTLLSVAVVSAATEVTVVETGRVEHHAFLPWPVAVVVTAAAVAAMAVLLRRRSRSPLDDLRRLEYAAVAGFAGSVIVYLVSAELPGSLNRFDAFHEGEGLGTAMAFQHGAFPWRDVLFIHGPLLDGLWPWWGLYVFGDSRWGAAAGLNMLVIPLCYVLLWLLLVGVIRRNWVVLVGFVTVLTADVDFFAGVLVSVNIRLAFLPVVVLVLAGALRATRPRAAALWGLALGAGLFASFVLTPELAFAVVAVGAVVVGFEVATGWGSGAALVARLPRTLGCLVGGLAAAAVFFAWLALNHAVDDFVFYFRSFAPDHSLTGAVPMELGAKTPDFLFAAVLPWALAAVVGAYLAWRLAQRATVRPSDWAMASLALLGILHYPKYLDRADRHVFAGVVIGFPLLVYVIARVLEPGDRDVAGAARGRVPRHLLSLAVVASLLLVAGPAALGNVRALPANFAPRVADEPAMERLGYAQPDAFPPEVVGDLQAALRAVGRGARLFDFTNQPGVTTYLLELDPPTRYQHVSMAIREPTQADLIDDLVADPPEVVLYWTELLGMPSWDGVINPVRHYDVSQWLLENYEPWMSIDGEVLYLRRDIDAPDPRGLGGELSAPAVTGDALRETLPLCEWGTAPVFLADDHQVASDGESLVAARVTRVATIAGRVPPAAASGTVLAVSPADRVLGEALAAPTATGEVAFTLTVPLAAGEAPEDLRLVTTGPDGAAVAIGDRPAPAPGTVLRFSAARTTIVSALPPVGTVDAVATGPTNGGERILRIDLPTDPRALGDWIELETTGDPAADQYYVGDNYGAPNSRWIGFRTTDRAVDRYLVQAASCPQWPAFTSGTLYVRHNLDNSPTLTLQRSLEQPGES